MAIARGLPRIELMCFGVGMRSRFLDDLLSQALSARGIEAVVSIGSGLDTRPWRMDLPAHLRWIEVDFPEMLDYKAAILAVEKPKCRLERVAADLNNATERRRIYSAARSACGLMITEGLLPYLPAATVEALASEPAAMSGIQYWLLDLHSPELARRTGTNQTVGHVRAASALNGTETRGLLGRNGWTPLERRSYITDVAAIGGERFRQVMQAYAQGKIPPPSPDDFSGVHLLGRK
jgi:methyltransferase (TIGR00027 family)